MSHKVILYPSGNLFDFNDLGSNIYDIKDIAHGLSQICRFGGHCRKFYSVAQHSVLISQRVSKEAAYAALMHDAVEFVVGDMTEPLKSKFPDYKILETKLEIIINNIFKIKIENNITEIRAADFRMRTTELKQLTKLYERYPKFYTEYEPYDDLIIDEWHPSFAETMFLRQYNLLRAPYAEDVRL